MGATTQFLERQGVLAPGQVFDTGPMQVGPNVPLGQGTRTDASMRDLRLFIAAGANGTMSVYQGLDFASMNTFPIPPAGRVQVTTINYVAGAGAIQVPPITVSAPYIRLRYVNGGVAAAFGDLWAAVTED